MALVQQHCSWRRGEAFDSERAVRFVRAHSSWTCRGLERAADPAAVAIVLGRHHAQHPNWLTLITALRETLGPAAAARVEKLYALHGRAAGALDEALAGGPHSPLAAAARPAMAEQLRIATQQVVLQIRELTPPVLEVVLDG